MARRRCPDNNRLFGTPIAIPVAREGELRDMRLERGSTVIEMTATGVTITGDITVTGDLTVEGALEANGDLQGRSNWQWRRNRLTDNNGNLIDDIITAPI